MPKLCKKCTDVNAQAELYTVIRYHTPTAICWLPLLFEAPRKKATYRDVVTAELELKESCRATTVDWLGL